MDTQNQNPQPDDYNFILNQGVDEKHASLQPGAPKNNKRKLVIIGGAIFIVFLLVLAAIAASISTKTQLASKDGVLVVSSYLENIYQEDYDAAYAQLSPLTRPSADDFKSVLAPKLAQKVDLSSCEQHGETREIENRRQVIMGCLLSDESSDIALSFLVVSPSGVDKIMESGIYVAKN